MFLKVVKALKEAGFKTTVERKSQRILIRDEENDALWIVSVRKFSVRKLK